MSQHFPIKPTAWRSAMRAIPSPLHRLVLLVIALAMLTASIGWDTHASAAAPPEDLRMLQSAAVADATKNLRDEIRAASITRDLTVNDLITRAGGEEEFSKLMHRAELIGGPRQIDEQTAQVRMELRGDRVATALVEIARQAGDRSPIKPDALAQALADWKNRTFSATGSSLSVERADSLPPGVISPVWRNVTKEAQDQAKAAAREDAVRRVLEAVGQVRVGGAIAGDIIDDNDSVKMALSDWLRKRPVNNLVFGDDLRVSYTLAASGEELFDQFLAAARQAKIPISLDRAAYDKAKDEFARRVTPTTGNSGNDNAKLLKAGDAAPATIPQQPPDWVSQQIEATGQAKYRDSKLQAQQEAVDHASEAIRAKLLALPLNKNESVGDARKHDQVVNDAVNRAIAQARIYHVSYPADGVEVKMALDPREFWQALSQP